MVWSPTLCHRTDEEAERANLCVAAVTFKDSFLGLKSDICAGFLDGGGAY